MGVEIRAWAPGTLAVGVVTADTSFDLLPMDVNPSWFVSPTPLAHGTDYRLRVGAELLPDPLSRWLPDGVHSYSRAWDAETVAWTDEGWRGRSIADGGCIYELHVGTFTQAGTLDSAIAGLDWLVELGITHVELMPLAAFDGEHGWGYDSVAINAVQHSYGGPDALCRFVDAAHNRGLAVLLDVVQNHLGPSGNYWDRFGPFLTGKYSTPWGSAVNLDDDSSDDVRRILLTSATAWLRDFHLDGIRLDAIHELKDSRALTYLEQLSAAVHDLSEELGRTIELIAETDRNDPRTVVPRAVGGLGMTAQWNDDVHHSLHWLLTGETQAYYADFGSCDAVIQALSRGFYHDGRWSSFRRRMHGRPIDFGAVAPWQLVVSLQTHDQVGNRARGDRLSQLVDLDRLAGGAAILFSLPFTPMLFMGEEWGAATPWRFFTSFAAPELAAAVTAGRRAEFADHDWDQGDVPDPQDRRTFLGSKLDWDELERAPHWKLAQWYRRLIALRADSVAFASGRAGGGTKRAADVRVNITENEQGGPALVVVTRKGGRTLVNLGDEVVTLARDARLGELVLAWPDKTQIAIDERSVTLPPGATAIFQRCRSSAAALPVECRFVVAVDHENPATRRHSTRS